MGNEVIVLGHMKRKAQKLILDVSKARLFCELAGDELHTVGEDVVNPKEVYGA